MQKMISYETVMNIYEYIDVNTMMYYTLL